MAAADREVLGNPSALQKRLAEAGRWIPRRARSRHDPDPVTPFHERLVHASHVQTRSTASGWTEGRLRAPSVRPECLCESKRPIDLASPASGADPIDERSGGCDHRTSDHQTGPREPRAPSHLRRCPPRRGDAGADGGWPGPWSHAPGRMTAGAGAARWSAARSVGPVPAHPTTTVLLLCPNRSLKERRIKAFGGGSGHHESIQRRLDDDPQRAGDQPQHDETQHRHHAPDGPWDP